MCGIAGIISKTPDGAEKLFQNLEKAVSQLRHRGPDNNGFLKDRSVALGHTRLSIIDLDPRSNQPMTDPEGRYSLAFNGEIYNFHELKAQLREDGQLFETTSDTEVLLKLLIRYKKEALPMLNGFFAFAFHDKAAGTILLARDRMGIKPLHYYEDSHTFAFASEMGALLQMPIEKKLDKISLFTYFKFNYIPAPSTILKGFQKLVPGHWLEISGINEQQCKTHIGQWYKIPFEKNAIVNKRKNSYEAACEQLRKLVKASVRQRMLSDVPLGTFLSGGIDSSVITAVAAVEKKHLHTFSIGYEEPYFDETRYARLVSEKYRTDHTVFTLSNEDLFQHLDEVLDHLNEPFADSSALPVYILSKETKKHVTVCLSGDGADELFAGYHKHMGELRTRQPGLTEFAAQKMGWITDFLPSSRNSLLGNKVRQLHKFLDGSKLSHRDRYWRWAGILSEEEANYLLIEQMLPREHRISNDARDYKKRKDFLLKNITKTGTLNEVLLTDCSMVLPNDMLLKTDLMSMAHGLEVRTPWLDHNIVEFAFRLPVEFKINRKMKKKIVQDAFRDWLPHELYNRPKQGFEVPLLKWFQGSLRTRLEREVFDEEFIRYQGLFNPQAVADLKRKLFSGTPGDAPATVWAFLVFQTWYRKYMLMNG